jgi:hypothetical protein
MITIPDDYFEPEPRSGSLFNSLGIMERVPKKFVPVPGLEPGQDPCPKNTGLYMYNPSTGKSMTLPCKSRVCPSCGKGWARQWQGRLGWNEFFYKDDKALTLTSAYDPGYKMFWMALKLFWKHVRNYAQVRPQLIDQDTGEIKRDKLYHKISPSGVKRWLKLKQKKLEPGGESFRIIRPFRLLEYFGIVEYNQNHTQPHFHFVLRSGYIPQIVIRKCWQRAQVEAGFKKVAFDVRIEQIRESVKQYFFKYITKLIEGKDELPRPENWSGRGVRYSRAFFTARMPLVNDAIKLGKQQFKDDYSKFYSLHSRKTPMPEQKFEADMLHTIHIEATSSQWDFYRDREAAKQPVIFEIPLSPHQDGSLRDIAPDISFESRLVT